MKTLNHTFFNDERVRAEVDLLERDFDQNFRVFCESIEITPAQLREVPQLKLLTVMLMRVYDNMSREIALLRLRLDKIEHSTAPLPKEERESLLHAARSDAEGVCATPTDGESN